MLVILRNETQSALEPHWPVPSLCLANPKRTQCVCGGRGHWKDYVVPLCSAGAQSFHPNPILLEGLALGANCAGVLVIRVPGLNHQEKKNVGTSAHRGGLFLAQRLIISLN